MSQGLQLTSKACSHSNVKQGIAPSFLTCWLEELGEVYFQARALEDQDRRKWRISFYAVSILTRDKGHQQIMDEMVVSAVEKN